MFKFLRRLAKPFVAPRYASYEEFCRAIEAYGYDLSKYNAKSIERLWQLYQMHKLEIRKPVQCDYSSSRPDPDWKPSSDGHANVAYMLGRAVPCPKPAIFYGIQWYGMLTSAYRPVQRCLDDFIWTTEYGERIDGDKALRVIA